MSNASSPPLDAGQEKAMAAAKRIVKSLAFSKNAADDMITMLSTYDNGLYPLSSPTGQEEEQEEAFEDVIRRCSSLSSDMTDYLYAVDDLIAAASHSGHRAARASTALQAAMPRLEDEMRSLLYSSVRRLSLSSDDVFDDSTPDASPRPDALSPRATAYLSNVASRMLRAGYGPELAQAYVAVRHDALAESVALLGLEAIAIEEVLKMEWPVLDQKMRRWSHEVRTVVKSLLVGERRLCEEVFALDDELGDECFADVARGCVLQLLSFVDAVAMSPRATEKLFRMLRMYEALTDVKPELEELFSGDARDLISTELHGVVAQLGATLCLTIEEFGSAIHGDPSRKSVHGGEIHPMTRYVLNYCGLLTDFRGTLDMVLGGDTLDGSSNHSPTAGAISTPSGHCMLELLTHLLRKMNDHSRLYDDAGLQYIFLMNNLYYIVQKVRDSALQELVGDHWIRRHRGQIRQYETSYLRASWSTVLSYLRDDTQAIPSAAYKAMLKDKARSFNTAFEELYRNQTSWKVSDPQLREELRIAVSERLLPAYRSFLGRSRTHLESGRHSTRYIKHSLEDLELYMLDFFEGAQKLIK